MTDLRSTLESLTSPMLGKTSQLFVVIPSILSTLLLFSHHSFKDITILILHPSTATEVFRYRSSPYRFFRRGDTFLSQKQDQDPLTREYPPQGSPRVSTRRFRGQKIVDDVSDLAHIFQVEVVKSSLNEQELIKKISSVHALGIRSKTKITDAVLAEAKRLLCVGCFCIGTDQVDLSAANVRGVSDPHGHADLTGARVQQPI